MWPVAIGKILASGTMLARYGIAALLFASGVDKLLHYPGFVAALDSYAVVPPGLGKYLALFVVCSELWIAGGLLVASVKKAAAAAASLLLTVFAVALTANFFLNPTADCGCWFTLTLNESTPLHILFNCTIAGLAATIALDDGG